MKKLRQKPTRAQWIKMGVVMALYLAFLVWIKSWWGLLVVPFIYDAYITKLIPWTWWKEAENPVTRTVMSWVDAIVFALVVDLPDVALVAKLWNICIRIGSGSSWQIDFLDILLSGDAASVLGSRASCAFHAPYCRFRNRLRDGGSIVIVASGLGQ